MWGTHPRFFFQLCRSRFSSTTDQPGFFDHLAIGTGGLRVSSCELVICSGYTVVLMTFIPRPRSWDDRLYLSPRQQRGYPRRPFRETPKCLEPRAFYHLGCGERAQEAILDPKVGPGLWVVSTFGSFASVTRLLRVSCHDQLLSRSLITHRSALRSRR